jgi:uncharacterized protein YdaU (DUF1376 family)
MAATNIWMAFCPGDYLKDTTHLSTRQHGAYMLLIFAYFINRGPLRDSDNEFAQITRLPRAAWTKERPIIERFFRIRDGFWIHKRVDEELAKADSLSKAAKQKALKRWKREEINDAIMDAGACPQHMPGTCQSQSQSQSPTEAEREQRASVDRPGWEEVRLQAHRIGLAEWKARDWFEEMEGCGWLDHHKRQVEQWQPILNRIRTKWEADGRPMAPPSNPAYARQTSGSQARPFSPLDIKTILTAKEAEANALKQRHASETAMGITWEDQAKRIEWVKLRKEIKDLNNKLAGMA